MTEIDSIASKELLGSAGIGIFVLNREFVITYANSNFASLLGYISADVLLGKPITSWINNDRSDDLEFFLHTCLSVGSIQNFVFIFESKLGTKVPMLIGATTTHQNKDSAEIICYCQNISALKQIEETLIKAKERAEESDKLKTAFLSNLSHEIRTPMNAIIGFSELLMSNELPIEQKEKYVNYINNSGSVLLKLIDDIIDIAKIQSNQLSIKKVRTDINSILYEIYSTYSKLLKTKKGDEVEIIWNKRDKDDRVKLFTDPLRFRQIFTNLLGNALKFTDKGSIEFGYDLIEEGETKVIRFFVKDTGIGLSEKNKDIVFNRFFRIENDSMRLYRGAGLGLTITKSLVDLLEGKIWVESELGKGSTFYFTFPVSDVELINNIDLSDKKEIDFSRWVGKTILVAEDEDINFIYIDEILKRYKLKILHAHNGQEAVQLFKENRHIVELILMDIKMPVMDGFEATEQIKLLSPDTPIIAQTAYALAGEREKIIDAGCDDYLSKPLKPKGLILAISKYIR